MQSLDGLHLSSALLSETSAESSFDPAAASAYQQTNDPMSLTSSSLVTQAGTLPSLDPMSTYTAVSSALQVSLEPAPDVLTLGGSLITDNADSVFVIGSQTLTPGINSIDGTSISLPPVKSFIVGGTSAVLSVPSPTSSGGFAFAGQTYKENTASDYIINGLTLAPGQQVTVSGTLISLFSTPTAVVIAGTIQTITNADSDKPSEIQTTFTFAGQTFTENAQSDLLIDGQTLTPGQAVTISGLPISLATTPTDVVVGSSTQGIASLIMGGFGNPGQSITPFTGRALEASPIPRLLKYWIVTLLLYIGCFT